MDGLRRLTVVIPSYGRHDYLRRQIEFWRSSDAHVVIVDGSPFRLPEECQLPSNIEYVHDPSPFAVRMTRSVGYVNSPYVAVLGDDDFFSPSGLRRCIHRLETDPGIVGCVGRSVRFFFQDGKVLAEQRDPESSEFPFHVISGLDRLNETYHSGKIGALFYGIYRNEHWSSVVRTAYSMTFATGYIYDTIIRVLMTYRGSVGVVDSLVWYCSSENPPVKTAPGMDRKAGFLDWLRLPEHQDEVRRCEQLMVDDLARLGVDSSQDLLVAVRQVMAELRRRYEVKEIRNESMAMKVRQLLIRTAPRTVKRLVKRFVPRSARKIVDWTVSDLDDLFDSLRAKGIDVDRDDAAKIIRAVEEFHGGGANRGS